MPCFFLCVLAFDGGIATMYIDLVWFAGTLLGLMGCFGVALCMGLGRPFGCEAALAPPSYV